MIDKPTISYVLIGLVFGYLLLSCLQILLPPSTLDEEKSSSDSGSISPPYSSFHCIGTGSQAFDWGVWLTTDRTMCKVYDVCIVDGELKYYEDPAIEGAAPDIYRVSAATASIRHGLWQSHEPALHVVPDERPRELTFAPGGRLYALDVMSDASNFGHLLIDTIIPAYAAASAFGAEPSSLQLLEWLSCDNFLQRATMQHKSDHSEAYVEQCYQHMSRWIPALFRCPILMPPYDKNVCFHELLIGHSGVMAHDRWFPHRGTAIRAMRLALYHNLHLPLPPPPPLPFHHIYVWNKRVEVTPSLVDVCATVMAWQLPQKVTCIVPAQLTLEEQVATFADATLVITEEGSTSYGAFFLRPGTSLVVFGAKEAHMMLSMSDLSVFFISLERLRLGQGPALVALALDRAARRIGVVGGEQGG